MDGVRNSVHSFSFLDQITIIAIYFCANHLLNCLVLVSLLHAMFCRSKLQSGGRVKPGKDQPTERPPECKQQ